MIIEIRDIPQGKKIKHLSVDIDFTSDSGDSDSSEVSIIPEINLKKDSRKEVENSKEATESKKDSKEESIPEIDISSREKKEIPQEMTELTF